MAQEPSSGGWAGPSWAGQQQSRGWSPAGTAPRARQDGGETQITELLKAF